MENNERDMTDRKISEAASEKRGPGRPRSLGAAFEDMIDKKVLGYRACTRRHVHDEEMAHIAYETLSSVDHPGLEWIINRRTVAAQLGRIRVAMGATSMLEAATIVFDEKPKVKDIIIRLMAWRLGRDSASPYGLYKQLARTLNTYMRQHPDIQWDGALRALDMLREGVMKQAQG